MTALAPHIILSSPPHSALRITPLHTAQRLIHTHTHTHALTHSLTHPHPHTHTSIAYSKICITAAESEERGSGKYEQCGGKNSGRRGRHCNRRNPGPNANTSALVLQTIEAFRLLWLTRPAHLGLTTLTTGSHS